MPTLMSGGSVVIPHGFAVSEFWNWLDDYRCTWSALVPTIISQLLDWKDPKAESRVAGFQRIRFLRTSSAPLAPSLHREFLEKFKLLLIQAMGSSEAGNVFSNPLPPGSNKIGSPGLPWGFEAKIVDRESAELPAGEPGEVLLRGDGMMQGYYKDPAGTAAALDAEGWLHTGDLAYRDEDGYFFVVGRSKELIIKGGMNIAPKQIDEVLEAHPAILEAAAVGIPDRYVGEDLVAFAVLRNGMSCDEGELLSFCENQLGHFKTPTRIYFVQDLPKGPSGKVQRLRLVEEAERRTITSSAFSTAVSPISQIEANDSRNGLPKTDSSLEQIIAGIWSDLLAQPQIDPDSNFFALGGQSLLGLQYLSRLREKIPVILSLSDFFENPTIARQVALVRERLSSFKWQGEDVKPQADLQPIPRRDQTNPCPLSLSQNRLWFLQRLLGEPVYNEAEAIRLKGKLDVTVLEQALNLVIARHEVLRSTIEVRDEQPEAIVHDNWPVTVKRIDLSGLPINQREAELARLLIEEPRRQYDLEAETGIRAVLIKLAADEHAFILMMQHLVCDSASVGILWRELATYYGACLRGQPADLPPLPIQYGDYAVWQRQPIRRAAAEKDLSFWREKLRGAPDTLDLPTDRPRPSVNSYRGTKRLFSFDTTLAGNLRSFSRRERASLFTVFAAALNVLFCRYTGKDDILVGIPIADRNRPETRSLIGFMIDTLVLRTDLSGNASFRELMSRVQRGVAEAYSYRAAPFDAVVDAVGPQRNLGYSSPLIQVMLNWRDRDDQLQFIGLPGLVAEPLMAHSNTSKFALTFTVTDAGDTILIEVEYNTDLFDEARIERVVGHLRTLLEGAITNPEQRLADLPLLTSVERHQLLLEWNPVRDDYRVEKCIHELFETQVERAPDAIAVVFEDRKLTYRELNRRANQVAHRLRKIGVAPDTLVGLFVERSLEMVVGMLGILKAGAAYLPLDPVYPKERLAFVLDDAQPKVVLTQQHLLDLLPANVVKAIALDSQGELFSNESSENLDHIAQLDDLAYVIYTSGSTGKPKGVLVTHRNVARLFQATEAWFHFDPKDVWTLFHSHAFDFSVWEVWGALAYGGRLVVVPYFVSRSPGAFYELLRRENVTVLNQTPSAFRQLIQAEQDSGNGEELALRLVIFGGEALEMQSLKPWFERHGDQHPQLINMYGITETTVHVTYRPLATNDLRSGSVIGIPIPDMQVYILDRHRQLVPIGIVGEMFVGGAGVARGYLNRPELTSEKFIDNPFSNKPGERLYRSGDLARHLANGDIEYLGRIDDQVKIRGFRIELGEIESVLNQHAAVKENLVVAREDEGQERRLVAYLVAKGSVEPRVSELRDFLRERLPEYMVPLSFVNLDHLPLTPNGKVDRKALPAPGAERPELVANYVAPSSPTEKILADLWAKTLGLERVGVHDNFFDLGGHSILMGQVHERVCKALKTNVSLLELFRHPTIFSLAQHLSQPSNESALLQKAQNRARRQKEAFDRPR